MPIKCPPACMPKDGASWKGHTIGKWVECMSIAAIVLSLIGGIGFAYTLHYHHDYSWFSFGDFCTFVVGICAIVNKCAIHNGCFFTVLWIVMLVVAIVNSVLMIVLLILVSLLVYRCGNNDYYYYYGYYNRYYYDEYYNPCMYFYIAIALVVLFAIPFLIFQWVYTFILFRAERIQKRCEERDFA